MKSIRSDLEARLVGVLRRSEDLMHVLRVAQSLELPDAMVFSGAIYQRALNDITGRPPDYGVKDYDLAYFDGSDLSADAEARTIRRVAPSFDAPLRDLVEVRNQARVHLWFESKFGEPYPPLRSCADALTRFASPMFAVGASLARDGKLTLVAPFGLEDLFALRLRPNPLRPNRAFARIAESVTRRWPEVRVEGRSNSSSTR